MSQRENFMLSHSQDTILRSCAKVSYVKHLHLSATPEEPPRETIKYEESKCPNEWKFVERILPPEIVPEPTIKPEYPSGWKPVDVSSAKLPYFVERSKNHMSGVYLVKSDRGQKIRTKIRRISGDIWALEGDIKAYLEGKHRKLIQSRVHEVTRCIWIKGDFVNDVQAWLLEKGF